MHRPVQEVIKSLTNQPPQTEAVIEKLKAVRSAAYVVVHAIYRNVPDGREKSLAITHLEETVMWAIKGIALNQ